jgi:hypothetical protein
MFSHNIALFTGRKYPISGIIWLDPAWYGKRLEKEVKRQQERKGGCIK